MLVAVAALAGLQVKLQVGRRQGHGPGRRGGRRRQRGPAQVGVQDHPRQVEHGPEAGLGSVLQGGGHGGDNLAQQLGGRGGFRHRLRGALAPAGQLGPDRGDDALAPPALHQLGGFPQDAVNGGQVPQGRHGTIALWTRAGWRSAGLPAA